MATCPKHEVGPGMKDLNPLRRSHAAVQARMLLSGDPAVAVEGYTPIPEGGIVAIGRDLAVSQF
jgi:hypothetical protein